ncbi:MAG: RICIN domain-containing protein [Clostridia bacterium]|nr:RICIN domain-containing protein [Clostridia bacterium]
MKKLCCLLLTFVLLFSTTALAVDAVGEAVAQPYSAGNPSILTSFTSHSYDEGIVDGAIYHLRNVYHGTHMDVNGANPAEGTEVSTYTFHGGTNQQFQFSYLGDGVYEISPVYTEKIFDIKETTGELIIWPKNGQSNQKFKVNMIGVNTGIIFTECSGFSKALCWDFNDPNSVVHKTYSDLADKTQAHWEFERVDTNTYDNYSTYYIRYAGSSDSAIDAANASYKDMYIDVIEAGLEQGTLIHLTHFYGNPNQEWKIKLDEDMAYYQLVPGHRRDMSLDFSSVHGTIRNQGDTNMQSFVLQKYDTDANGVSRYRIGVAVNGSIQYIAMGDPLADYDRLRYVDRSETTCDLWTLERVSIDIKRANLLLINQEQSTSVSAGYNDPHWFTYASPKPSRYKIELNGSNVDVGFIKNAAGAIHEALSYKTYNGKLIVDVFFEANTPYFIPVEFTGINTGGTSQAFTIRIRQLTFVGHSAPYDTENGIDMAIDIDRVRTYCNQMNILFNHKTNMTVAQAKASLSDFNADIFVYSGHGASGYACYEKSVFGMFDADDLPDMSNCELAVWDCCKSALPSWGDSVASKSVENGARAAVGWSDEIRAGYSEDFMDVFFRWLSWGSSVRDAARYAICEHSHFVKARTLAENLVIFGDSSSVLYPDNTNAGNMPSCNHSDHTTLDLYLSNYALMVENVSLGIRVYNRMIEGIPTDDYFIEYYDDSGVVTEVHKSEYTLTEEDYASAMNQIAQLHQSNIATASVEENISYEYYFQYIAGELRVVEERISVNDMGYEICTVYDALTGEVIAYD